MSLLINSKWTDLRFQLHLLNNAFCWRKQLSIETNVYSHWKLLNIANYLKISLWLRELWVSLMAVVKNPPANAGAARAAGLIPGPGRSPGVGNGNTLQYSFLEIPWTEDPGRLQSMGSWRIGCDWVHTTSYSRHGEVTDQINQKQSFEQAVHHI